jgi:hypothetical protein
MNDENEESLYISAPSLRPPRLCANLVFSAELRKESRRDAEGAEKNFAEIRNTRNWGERCKPLNKTALTRPPSLENRAESEY